MVQAIIDIDEKTNRVLNIIKAKYALKDKSESIEQLAREYEEEVLEPQLRVRPEYIKKLKRIAKGKHYKFSDIKELRKEIENV